MAALLKVFRCGPRHDGGGREMAAHVDKPSGKWTFAAGANFKANMKQSRPSSHLKNCAVIALQSEREDSNLD